MQETLNKKLFDSSDKLLPKVRQTILNIVGEFMDSIDVEGYVPVLDIILVGSNVSYNYNETSDLDIHIIVNYSDICDCKEVVAGLMNADRSLFNKDHEITIKGIPTEIYVEDVHTNSISNGIYSVMFDRWEKFPSKETIKDVSIDENDPSIKEMIEYFETLTKPGVSSEEIESYINSLYLMRKYSIANEGEYGYGNQVFKKIRSIGLLDKMKQAVKDAKSRELSLESKRLVKESKEDLLLKFVGGKYDGDVFTKEQAMKLPEFDGNINNTGRQELVGMPKISGYAGPFWNGDHIRYEDWDTYKSYSI